MSMTAHKLSPLEAAVAAKLYDLYRDRGFPSPDRLFVQRRENTGSGRYVDLEPVESQRLEDGYLDLGGSFIELSGVPNGLMAVARIRNSRLDQIEISVYGDDPWDGEERAWKIV
jgi:hypothetical protein